MAIQATVPKWQRELMSFKGIKSTYIIEGNINDRYPFLDCDTGETTFNYLNETLERIFNDSDSAEEYDFIFCDPIFGINEKSQNMIAELAKKYQDIAQKRRKEVEAFNEGSLPSDNIVQISEIIRAIITQADEKSESDQSTAVVVNFASRLISSPDRLNPSETSMFLNLLYATKNAIRVGENLKTLILIVDKFNDIPAWFYLNNPNVRTMTIPNPDRETREIFISNDFDALNAGDENIHRLKAKFTDKTEGMKILELDELRRLYNKMQIPVTEILDTVSIYKFGFKENKWEAMRDRMDSDIISQIRKRVKGQEEAIEKIARIIKRSITGLSGMQHSSGADKPRGIMFLAGPTGTGKTEVVKTVAECLFGDEKAMIRFDMSEYTAEHADQKLFGAPPGYVGYDQGGQLTNAVKSNPFSILLFDEIEKAHPSIMDKFLQILEDGRMTDGQGNTVYFSETLIFFTSNAGITEETCDVSGRVVKREIIVKPGSSYDEIQKTIEFALKTKFKPEVLNRIGRNIIVFDYITEKATSEILASQLENIIMGIQRKSKIWIELHESAQQYLMEKCLELETRETGGRGIGNVVESFFLNPLSEYLFDANVKAEEKVEVKYTENKLLFERVMS